jgi:WD40 repeat protein/serine/threonine protein kinase/tetratricopeptide (TPR) repeat protein
MTALQTIDVAAEPFVKAALRQFEHDFRELALLALAHWESLEIVAPELFRSVAGLQRPSWGHWNGLLTALRAARKRLLREGTAAQRDQLRSASILNAILDLLDSEPDTDLVASLRALAKHTRTSLPRKPRLSALLTLPITLRNDIAHFQPTDPAWWQTAADTLRPLVSWTEAHPLRPAEATKDSFAAPWFLDGPTGGAFNGFREDAVVYVTPTGEPLESAAMVQPLHTALQRLFGQQTFEAESLKKLLTRSAPEELRGLLLGDFLIRGPAVGRGGFAVVFAGVQVSTGRRVAVKVLHDGLSEDDRARFLQEGVLLSQFNHPHIVGVIAQGEGPWFPPREPAVAEALAGEEWFRELARSGPVKTYLALEWIEGHTLEQIFKGARSERPSVAEMTRWFVQAAEAVAAVHSAGLLHRDVTPSNLLVQPEAEVVLMDFGIARPQDTARTIHTTPGRILGTRAYMAPEQVAAQGSAEVGPAVDVYGLCATFYELYTGTRLFGHDRETEQTVITRKLTEPRPTRPRSLRGELPWEVDVVLAGGLEADVGDRYKSAADLARDLGHVLRNEPIEYQRPSLARRTLLFYRRNTLVTSLAATLIVVLVAVAIIAFVVAVSYRELATSESKAKAGEHEQRQTAEERLVRGYLREADRQISDADNPLAALPFLAEAYRYTSEDKPGKADAIRLNLGVMLAQVPRRVRQLAHAHTPAVLACSPDGRYLVTCENFQSGQAPSPGQEGADFSLWDPDSGTRLAGPIRLDDPVRVVAFSPDGTRFAVGTGTDTGRQGAGETILFELPSGKRIGAPLHHPSFEAQRGVKPRPPSGPTDWVRRNVGIITAVLFSPKGERLITCSDDATICFWDAYSGQRIGTPLRNGGAIRTAVLTPNGSGLVTVDDRSIIRLWDLTTRQLRLDPAKTKLTGRVLDLHPDGTTLATADYSEGIKIWSLRTGEQTMAITGVQDVDQLQFNPGGDRLLAVQRGIAATLWDLSSNGRQVQRFPHTGLRSATFSPDGMNVLTVGDGVRFWDVQSGLEAYPCIPDDKAVFHPDGDRVFSARDKAAWVWQLPLTTRCPVPFPSGQAPASANVFLSPNRRSVVFAFEDWQVKPNVVHCVLIDTVTGRPSAQGWLHAAADRRDSSSPYFSYPLFVAAYSADSALVATAGGAGAVQLHAAMPGSQIPASLAHPCRVIALAFGPVGDVLATGGTDQLVRLWSPATGHLLGEPIHCRYPIRQLTFSPDGSLLTVCSNGEETELRLWNPVTQQPVAGPFQHKGEPRGAWVWPGPGRLLANGESGIGVIKPRVYVWNLADGHQVCEPLEGAIGRASAFDNDGRQVVLNASIYDTLTMTSVAGFSDKRIRSWHPASGLVVLDAWLGGGNYGFRVCRLDGQPLTQVIPLPAAVEELIISPDGRLIAAATGGNLYLWDARTGDPIGLPRPIPDNSDAPQFISDSRALMLVPKSVHLGAWVLTVPLNPLEQAPELVAGQAQLLAGLGLDDTGSLIRVDVQAAWKEGRLSLESAADPERLRAWHLARAYSCGWNNRHGAVQHLERAAAYGAEVDAALGQAYLRVQRWAAARDAFTCAITHGNTSSAVRSGRGEALVKLKSWQAALVDLDAAVAAGADDQEVFFYRASARAETGDVQGALRDTSAGLKRGTINMENPDLARFIWDNFNRDNWRTVSAYVDRLLGESQRDLNLLDSKVAGSINKATAQVVHGIAQFLLGDALSAADDFNDAIGANGDAEKIYRYILDTATQRFAADSQEVGWLALRGLARVKLGEYEAGIADLGAALQRTPGALAICWTQGESYAEHGDWVKAEEAYTNGLKKTNTIPAQIFWRRGQARAQSGKLAAALADFRTANQRDATATAY